MSSTATTARDPGYSAPSSASVYALAEPDHSPLPEPTRARVDWHGRSWEERDAAGELIAVHLHADREEPASHGHYDYADGIVEATWKGHRP